MVTFILSTYNIHILSDSKIKLIMLENNTNNHNENLIRQNKTCHLQCDDQLLIVET
jgi:hypothetical protein